MRIDLDCYENESGIDDFELSVLNQEIVETVYKVGSYISICENKKFKPLTLLLLLFEHAYYREIFVRALGCNTFQEGVLILLYLYPSLAKSKSSRNLILKAANNFHCNGII